MSDPQDKRKEQIDMLKGLLKGAKDDPKGAAVFVRDVAKEQWNDPKRKEQRDMGKAMLQGAVKDPKGALEFVKAVVKEERAKRKPR
ncbi:MAG: hypothetical protein LT071_13610 [Nocardioides sp.]|nr:hypothetical protein [Nocardioides sp.]